MITDVLLLGGLGLGALWYASKRTAKRDELAGKALDVAASVKPMVSISNVEAIEERQVWIFKPTLERSLKWKGGIIADVEAAYKSLGPTPSQSAHVGHTLEIADVMENAFLKNASMNLVPGGWYSAKPRMGESAFSDIRLRYWGTDFFYNTGPFVFAIIVPPEIWDKWWITRIATVAEQIEAGGVQTVPPALT